MNQKQRTNRIFFLFLPPRTLDFIIISGEGSKESQFFYLKIFKLKKNNARMMHKSDLSFENFDGKAQMI